MRYALDALMQEAVQVNKRVIPAVDVISLFSAKVNNLSTVKDDIPEKLGVSSFLSSRYLEKNLNTHCE